MNKAEIFYIVVAGTNHRVLTSGRIPLMVEKSAIDNIISICDGLVKLKEPITYEFESISVEEYENKFEELKW